MLIKGLRFEGESQPLALFNHPYSIQLSEGDKTPVSCVEVRGKKLFARLTHHVFGLSNIGNQQDER